jgi:hypothetical protein
VFDNGQLRRILWAIRRLVEDLYQLCCSPDIIWMNSIGEACGAYGGDGAGIQGFGGKILRKEFI